MVRAHASRAAQIGAFALTALVSACATPGGPPPPPPSAASGSIGFSAEDFAWSRSPGSNIIAGRVAYRQGAERYACAGASVVLTPETPWSRRRMAVLYGSTERAALPAEEVRARTPGAPAGDAGPFIKRTTCDEADQFAFSGLADGAWFVITIAKPANDPKGPSVALMRRVVTRGGRMVQAIL